MISDPGTVLLPSQRGALGLSICQPAQLQAFRVRVQDRLLVLPLRLQVGHRQVCPQTYPLFSEWKCPNTARS